MHHKATKQAKSTPTTHQKKPQSRSKPDKNHQICKNGLGLLSKTHTLPPPRQAISLLALVLLVFELAPSPPKQKLNRTKRLALAT